jgi:uncharacterized protein (DUF1501 family)
MGDCLARDRGRRSFTEFGRTARINGTEGTRSRHRHGGVPWPAARSRAAAWSPTGRRSRSDLHEKRDLKPTTDLRAVLKGLLRDHLRVDEAALASKVFPESSAVKPVTGLLA